LIKSIFCPFTDRHGAPSIGSSMASSQAPVRTEWAKIRATIREDENDWKNRTNRTNFSQEMMWHILLC